MGLTYEWKLTGLKKQNGENITEAVVGTQWKLTGTDEDGDFGKAQSAAAENRYKAKKKAKENAEKGKD